MTLSSHGPFEGKKTKKKTSPICITSCSFANYPHIFKEGKSKGEANSSLYLD